MDNLHHQNKKHKMTQVGKISEINVEKSLVRVDVLGRITPWLPVLQMANSFKRHWIALRVDEQVLVLDGAFVIRGIFNADCKEPIGADYINEIIEYEDGTTIEYNTFDKTLAINSTGSVNVTAKSVNVRGTSGDVIIDGISLVNHTHPQNGGDHHGGGTNTSKPQ